MQALAFQRHGGPEVLAVTAVPVSQPGPGELLVRVRAAGCNPIDTKVRRGEVPIAPDPARGPVIVGYDAAGVVDAVGSAVRDFAPGDEVYFAGDVTRRGSYAPFCAVDARLVARKPPSLSFEEAAGVPLTALTAWEALLENMRLHRKTNAPGNANKTVLIVGGGGGVGSMAIQIAKRVVGARVVATVSREESRHHCLSLGADAVIDHRKPLAPQFKGLGLPGADFILNGWGFGNFAELVDVLNPVGHLCLLVAGPEMTALDVSALRPKRGALSFEFMFTRPLLNAEPQRHGAILAEVADLLEEGVLRPAPTQVLPLADAAEAHRQLETGHTLGKLVLGVDGAS